jgi:hypothetical protein
MTQQLNEEFLKGFEKIPTNWVKWGKPGDKIKGTLIDTFEVEDNYTGKKQTVYILKADGGSFHNIAEKVISATPTEIEKGSVWNVGGRYSIDRVMRNLKLGTRVAIMYVSDVTTPKGTAKSFNVLSGGFDAEWQASNMADALGGKVEEDLPSFN